MKILLVADEESKYIWDYFDPEPFRGVELIISCGDLKAAYLEFLVTMIPAPLFYVPGNHDKRFEQNPPKGCECIDGKIKTYKGLRFFGLGGSKSGRKDIYEYTEKNMRSKVRRCRFSLRKSRGFDVFVTHAPAFGIGDGKDLFHQGFEVFRELDEKYGPKYHFYGHQHKRYGDFVEFTEVDGTQFVNAAGYKVIEI